MFTFNIDIFQISGWWIGGAVFLVVILLILADSWDQIEIWLIEYITETRRREKK